MDPGNTGYVGQTVQAGLPPVLSLSFAPDSSLALRKHTIFGLYNGPITPHSQSMTQFDLRRQDCIEGMLRLTK